MPGISPSACYADREPSYRLGNVTERNPAEAGLAGGCAFCASALCKNLLRSAITPEIVIFEHKVVDLQSASHNIFQNLLLLEMNAADESEN